MPLIKIKGRGGTRVILKINNRTSIDTEVILNIAPELLYVIRYSLLSEYS